MYVEHMVEVCRELKRVLKKAGSMYIVIGDTYASKPTGSLGRSGWPRPHSRDQSTEARRHRDLRGIPEKCLMGIPWRLALALIDDGWILRNDIIWHKPNAMPSSVKDRLTQTYEHIFHFVKSRKYYYNLDNIRETPKTVSAPFNLRVRDVKRGKGGISAFGELKASEKEVESYVYPENIFIEGLKKVYSLMMKADSSYNSKYRKEGDGQSLQFSVRQDAIARIREASRQVAKELFPQDGELQQKFISWVHDHASHPRGKNPGDVIHTKHDIAVNRIGNFSYTDPLHSKAYNLRGKNPGDYWSICTRPFKGAHFAVYPIDICLRPILSSCPPDGVILDPMCGSGTTMVAAELINRGLWGEFKIPVNNFARSVKWSLKWIGIEINPKYVEIALNRLKSFPKTLDEYFKTQSN